MLKCQSTKVKSRLCSFPISVKDSDCNSIFKLADSIQVTIMEMKKKA